MTVLRPMTPQDIALFDKWLRTPHVARWYHDPSDWLSEVARQDSEFNWIHHFIAEYNGIPAGFCQYYSCADSDELWGGRKAADGTYSIDYMIGEAEYLRRGIGRKIVFALIEAIKQHNDARYIIAQPELENEASRCLLRSCGFDCDSKTGVFTLTLK